MFIPLPASLKQHFRATPQGCSLAMEAPQAIADLHFLVGSAELDVTDSCAVAALRPFALRIEATEALRSQATKNGSLRIRDRENGRTIGLLQLQFMREWRTGDVSLYLYAVTGGTHYCAHRLRRTWDTLLYRLAARGQSPGSKLMNPAAVEHTMVFYSCPRPVYFVSVDDGVHSNLFPMDLVGPISRERFTLALRNTSPSVETMKSSRRVALGDVPASAISIAYKLGSHHKSQQTDWSTLPFDSVRSSTFGLRVPAISLRIRELELLDCLAVGSHTLFVAHIRSDVILRSGPQLFHSSGAYQAMRSRQGRPFATIQPHGAP